jgi:hypothetical protein
MSNIKKVYLILQTNLFNFKIKNIKMIKTQTKMIVSFKKAYNTTKIYKNIKVKMNNIFKER